MYLMYFSNAVSVSSVVNSGTWLFWAVQSDQTSDFTCLQNKFRSNSKKKPTSSAERRCEASALFKIRAVTFSKKHKRTKTPEVVVDLPGSCNHRR